MSATAAEYAALAAKQVGKRYVLGQPVPYKGGNPAAMDCSGLIIWLNNATGALPMGDDTAAGLYNRTTAVKAGSEKVGDLVFLRNNAARSNGIGHVAVLTSRLSNGDWLIIEAKGTSYGVVKTTLSYWKTRAKYTGVRRLKGFKLATAAKPKQVPIVIVAGSANTAADALHSKYRRRLDVAIGLLRKDPALRVIVTGGIKPGHKRTEAAVAKTYLTQQGIAASRIIEEGRSGSTNGNFSYGLPLARAAGATSLVVVSDRSHMRRCLAFAYAADKAKSTGIPISGAAWYSDSSSQDATVSQAAAQARAVWSGMTDAIVRDLDAKWGVAAATKPTPSKPVIPVEVRKGSKGAVVRQLQQALNRAGAKLTVDGDFGGKTEAAVRAYQRKYKLTVDGVVGPATWAALLA